MKTTFVCLFLQAVASHAALRGTNFEMEALQSMMPMTQTVAYGSGKTCSYPDVLLPDNAAPSTTTARAEATFIFDHVIPMKSAAGEFNAGLESAFSNYSSASALFESIEPLFDDYHPLGSKHTYKNISNLQGGNGAWKTDRYASELFGHTLLASFLTPLGGKSGTYEVDFTGSVSGNNASTVSTLSLKDEIVALAPDALLRCRAELVDAGSRPELTTITVYSPETGAALLTATPADGVRWEVAKIVLHGMGAFVVQTLHTSVHLLASVATTSALRSLPRGSVLSGMLDPQHTQVVTAIWTQADKLHAEGGGDAFFNGQVYACDIGNLRALNVKVVRHLLQCDPREFLGLAAPADPATPSQYSHALRGGGEQQQAATAGAYEPQPQSWSRRPEWWAGGAGKFVAPIEAFAAGVARATVADSQQRGRYLATFQQELVASGALGDTTSTTSPSLDVSTAAGLARLHANMLFFESVFHGAIFATREYALPIAMPMTAQFLPYLAGAPGAAEGVASVDDAIDKFVTADNLLRGGGTGSPLAVVASVCFGTASGLNGADEISDGPFYNQGAWVGGGAEGHIEQYQAEIAAVRASVMGVFGGEFAAHGEAGAGFLPGYYYPAGAPKPSGYAMTETVYI